MDIILAILAAACLLAGLVGSVVPLVPGPPLSYVGLLLLQWSRFGGFSTRFMLVWALIVVVVTLLDIYMPVWMTRRFGGSRAATIGAAAGMVAGFFLFPPVGIIICPFIGALTGELIHNRTDGNHALKVALGAFAAFIAGTGLKLIISAVMLFYAISAFFR